MWHKISLPKSGYSEKVHEELQEASSVEISVVECGEVVEFFGDFGMVPANYAPFAEPIRAEIDWTAQWTDHSPGYHDGVSSVTLPTGKTISLKPGGGFGDFSHPTTKLMLELMAPYVSGKTCVDVGCGSGILTVAALAMGAKEVWAIDIDPLALAHTRENLLLTDGKARVFGPGEALPKETPDVILCNMIRSEQEIALNQYASLKSAPLWITSGILIEEEPRYLKWAYSHGWAPLCVHSLKGWVGFVMNYS